MLKPYCGADCETCMFRQNCKGCRETCGSPFGGRCVAAEYIKLGGADAYREFKDKLTAEINAMLKSEGIPEAGGLYELLGEYVNLGYPLPDGKTVKFLDDKNVYLGAQIESVVPGVCFGVIADTSFILICKYGEGGSDPELILYKRR